MYHRPATRSHENGDLSICRKYARMVPLREIKVLSAVSSLEDLTQLEDGNGMSIITEFNPWYIFYFILKICPETLFSSIKDRMLNYYLNQYYILVSDLRLFFSKLSSRNTICYPSANIFTIMPLF